MNGQYTGLYLGTVQDNKDPERRGRLRLHIPSILPDENHPMWAEPMGFALGPNSGTLMIPALDTLVCVMFLEGAVDRPFWMPGPYAQQKQPELANSSQHYPERVIIYQSDRTKTAIWIDKDGEITIKNQRRGVKIITEGGHIEIDSKPGGEVKINRPSPEDKVARKNDPVGCGTLTATAPPGGGPVTFVYVDGNGTPHAPSQTVTVSGRVENGSSSVLAGG